MTKIATGSFYKYFDSKEELFIEVYFEENIRIKQEMVELVKINKDPIEAIHDSIYILINKMEENPILRVFFDRNQFDKIAKKMTPHMKERHYQQSLEIFSPFFEKWISTGEIKLDDPNKLLALIDSIFIVYSHKFELNEEYFSYLLETLISSVTNTLRP